MKLNDFIGRVLAGELVGFQDTMSVIADYYDYHPTEFSNGIRQPLINGAGRNEGSCKIFAFAKLHGLTQSQTLALFGDYYRKDVLQNPDGDDHQNIRNFLRDGWEGIRFESEALVLKRAD
ncbi:HopJ type III effector protein [Methylomonas sp. MgM2]